MALNTSQQIYRGVKANLAALASTGHIGVLAYTTDTQELYVDTGAGTGIGAGNAWIRFAPNSKVYSDANLAARTAAPSGARTPLLGDFSVQADTGVTYVLQTAPSTTAGNWTAIGLASAPVTSVFGRTGAVVATANDYAFSQISGTAGLAQGGTNADLSATGGATQFIAQNAAHVISARVIAAADLPTVIDLGTF